MVVYIPALFYQQFNADYCMEVPAEGFNGWQKERVPIDLHHTALVIMHAWNTGSYDEYPGWYRYVEYLPRAKAICEEVFPKLINAVRGSPMEVFHVVSSADYYKSYPGYERAKRSARKIRKYIPENVSRIKKGKTRKDLDAFRSRLAGVGSHNAEDIERGFINLDFAPNSKPVGNEGIAESSRQLAGLCRNSDIDHLIYVGFAINWCLLLSPGGMAEMSKHGLLCSTIKEATTAVENDFTAREEWCKKIALWRVALKFGFVFELDDFFYGLSG